jgi:hypothetical protein
MALRFWMSARKAENGFLGGRIVSLPPAGRNIRGKIVNIFNVRKMPGFQMRKNSRIPDLFGPVGTIMKVSGRQQNRCP